MFQTFFKKKQANIFLNILLIFLITVVFLLGSVEILLRTKFIQPSFYMHGFHFVLDRNVLYRIKPKSAPDINSHGYRGPEYAIKKQKHKKRIAFLGDSFVMGMGAEAGETIPASLQSLLPEGHEVINMGVLGYGPDQSYVQFHEDVLELKPDIVVLGIFPANDYKDFSRNQLMEFDTYGQLRLSEENIVRRVYPKWETAYFYNYIKYLVGRDDNAFRDVFELLFGDQFDFLLIKNPNNFASRFRYTGIYRILEKFKQNMEAGDIKFLVVIFPSADSFKGEINLTRAYQIPRDKYFFLEALTATICKNLGIEHINLYLLFFQNKTSRFRFNDSGHFTPEASQEISRYIFERFQKTGWLQ